MKREFPKLTINTELFRTNARNVIKECSEYGIDVCVVSKGFNSMPELAKIAFEEGAKQVATSRLEQIQHMKENGVKGPFLLTRVPSTSELEAVSVLADYSLESDWETLTMLNNICRSNNINHKAIMMVDLGDLREGYWDRDEFVNDCIKVEYELSNICLAGIGVNLGCYGSIVPTPEKMNELALLAKSIENSIGRKLEIVSGGATSSYLLVHSNEMPEGINHLRIGEAIEQPLALKTLWDIQTLDYLSCDVFKLYAQVMEVRVKASHPQGKIFIDAFENTPVYEDKGNRLKALVCIGRADYGAGPEPVCDLEGAIFLGASGDHTIIDITDCKETIKVGDILSFSLPYSSVLYLSRDSEIAKEFI